MTATRAPAMKKNAHRDLVAAIVARAVEDVREGGEEARNARAWILSGRTGPGPFKWACESLDLDPKRVGRIIDRMPPPPPPLDRAARIAAEDTHDR